MSTTIVFPGAALETLRRSLLESAPMESAAILLAGRASEGDKDFLLVRECHLLPADAYLAQERLRAIMSPAFVAPLLKRARIEGWSVILVHTHPFESGVPTFSLIDDAGEQEWMPSLFGRAPDRLHGAMVIAPQASVARTWSSPRSGSRDVEGVIQCGQFLRNDAGAAGLDETYGDEFDRSVRAFGAAGQATLRRLTVGIIGVGGTGSIVAEQLAHLGVRRFILVDPDNIEATNLNRVVGSVASDVGRRKVDVTAELVSQIRPDAVCKALHRDVCNVTTARRLLDADIMFCCTDSHGSRYVLNQFAYQFMKPVIDLGVTIDARDGKRAQIFGRVQLLAPGLPCLQCQNLLDPEQVRRDLLTVDERSKDPYLVGIHEPQPAVISLNGTVSSMAVTMMLGAVTSFPAQARHQILMGERGIVRSITSQQEPNCIVCSLKGAFGRGDLCPMPGRPA